MPESPIRTHLRLVREGSAGEASWGRQRTLVPETAIVAIGRAEPGSADSPASELGQAMTVNRDGAPAARPGATLRKHISVIAGGLTGTGWGRTRRIVPKRAFVPVGRQESVAVSMRMPRKHVLMLVLAVEILCLGALFAANPPRRGITVDEPLTTGNVVT